MQQLISIIIPTYNRAHLIGKTLDSVLAQTYTNWECIVVDDGSTDNTANLLEAYCKSDSRIQYHHRPTNKPKGANTCRNYGFQISKGDYIQWFDSDDLMSSNHLQVKVETLKKKNCDFVVAQTSNFDSQKIYPPYTYSKMEYGITFNDFILRKIHWYTYDVMLVRKIASKIKYHETMSFWQDFYYFCLMLLETTRGVYIDEVLTNRRLHSNSIQDEMNKDIITFNEKLLEVKVLTYMDIEDKVELFIKKELIFGLMNHCFMLASKKRKIKYINFVSKTVKGQLGFKAILFFYLALLSAFVTAKGHYFLSIAKNTSLSSF